MTVMDMITKLSKLSMLLSMLHGCTMDNKLKNEIFSSEGNRCKIYAISDTLTDTNTLTHTYTGLLIVSLYITYIQGVCSRSKLK